MAIKNITGWFWVAGFLIPLVDQSLDMDALELRQLSAPEAIP